MMNGTGYKFDPVARAAEKERSRQRDLEDLESGRKSATDLMKENCVFVFSDACVQLPLPRRRG